MVDEARIPAALRVISEAMVGDPAYAHAWHCNVACAAMDEGVEWEKAQRIATRVMRLAFSVHTESEPERCGQPYESINSAGVGQAERMQACSGQRSKPTTPTEENTP